MPNFVYGPLLWGMLAVGAPLLIHLINMMRHRRIRWAAMEFLLQSQKRNRTWIMLKQFLLLLLRMAAIAAVVLLVAQPLFKESFGSFLGGTRTHHIVLLDDSFSQSDTWGNTTAFKEGLAAVEQVCNHAIVSAQDSSQVFTLIRFSQAAQQEADLKNRIVNGEFKTDFDAKLKELKVSQLDSGPLEALKYVNNLGDPAEEKRVVYIVSDFRGKEWDSPEEMRKQLIELQAAQAQLHLIGCAQSAQKNLAIVGLEPEPGVKAAGVELYMQVAVRNFGDTAERDVAVSIRQDDDPGTGIKFDLIGPGQTQSKHFPVNFKDPKSHRVTATLPASDPVLTDNERFCIVDIAPYSPALVIDGDPKAARVRGDAYFLSAVLTPGGQVNTGIRPRIESPRYFSSHALDEFAVIYLLNVERLDEAEIKALDEYVRKGGGLAFFMGPLCNAKFFNDNLYAEGKGIFPLPLAGPVDLLVDRTERVPDIEVSKHELFVVFADQSANKVDALSLDRYFAAQRDWQPGSDTATQIIARTRNGAPLVVEKKIGGGRVVAFLTTASPIWNNWGKTGPWITIVLKTHSYLSVRPEIVRLVGSELNLRLDLETYHPPFTWTAGATQAATKIEKPADAPRGTEPISGDAAAKKPTYFDLLIPKTLTRQAGFYELALPKVAKLAAADGPAPAPGDAEDVEKRPFAYNVSSEEGNLKLLSGEQLATQLKGVSFNYHRADQMHYDSPALAGLNVSKTWIYMFVLMLLLLGEQLLAYAISYHPAPKEAAR